ncbi:hypothetical protein [Aeromonas cavernicola]|uniref:Uncharacterized protein n=1 Tax=Aeromonas cavernicola TaxID=1006623 RepID=A0A2H9U550_9GAMM|nr:hypothetical protein [Aeromonas cavernicola]PJG59119.1 hypothetical protein CUC53_09030 [Aeromonas cavernicola]
MWWALKWFFISWALLLMLSDIQISTSLYQYQQNRVLINIPRWQANRPWATLQWHVGRIEAHWYGLAGKPAAILDQ